MPTTVINGSPGCPISCESTEAQSGPLTSNFHGKFPRFGKLPVTLPSRIKVTEENCFFVSPCAKYLGL